MNLDTSLNGNDEHCRARKMTKNTINSIIKVVYTTFKSCEAN